MGVEYKLSRNDHEKVEDFLARRPAGVTAITIDAHLTRYQAAAAEAALATGGLIGTYADFGCGIGGFPPMAQSPLFTSSITTQVKSRITGS